jgi:hypothetical protein
MLNFEMKPLGYFQIFQNDDIALLTLGEVDRVKWNTKRFQLFDI